MKDEEEFVMPTALAAFKAGIRRYTRLSPEEQKDLGYRKMQGDKAAYDRLVNHNLRLITAVTWDDKPLRRQIYAIGLDPTEVFGAAYDGLRKAVKNWDPDLGTLSTYAYPVMKDFIRRYLDKQNMLKIPRDHRRVLAAIGKAEAYYENLGEDYSTDDIVQRSGVLNWKH